MERSRHGTPRPHGPWALVAIAAGGALGTLCRYGVERGLSTPPDHFPWATLIVNVVGSFLLGAVLTLVVERWPTDRFLRPFAAVGFCGGFTTFSTLAVEVDQRVQHGMTGLAAAYVVLSLFLGLGAALAGITLVRGRILPAIWATEIPDPDVLEDDDRIVGRDEGAPP